MSAGLLAAVVAVSALTYLISGTVLSRASPDLDRWWGVGAAVLVDVGFVVVVASRARTPDRRLPTTVVAVLAAVLGNVAIVLPVALLSVVRVWLSVLAAVLMIAAWGLARRRHPGWMWGLVPAAVLVLGYFYVPWWRVLLPTGGADWWGVDWWGVVAAALWWATIGVGCLACWAFDSVGRRRAPAGTATGPPAADSAAPTSSQAIAALVAAVVFAPAGVALGHRALTRIDSSGDGGRALAVAALVIGYVGTAVMLMYLLMLGYLVVTYRMAAG